MAKEANKEVNLEKLKALQLTMDKLDKTYGKSNNYKSLKRRIPYDL